MYSDKSEKVNLQTQYPALFGWFAETEIESNCKTRAKGSIPTYQARPQP